MSFFNVFIILLLAYVTISVLAAMIIKTQPRVGAAVFIVASLIFTFGTSTLLVKDVQKTTLEACKK